MFPFLILTLFGIFPFISKALPVKSSPAPTASGAPTREVADSPNPWFWLHAYDGTMTRSELTSLLEKTFDPFDGLKPYIEYSETEARFYPSPTDHREPQFVLSLATAPLPSRAPGLYRTPAQFRTLSKPSDKPLQGLKIAIDPGHIGGKWGEIEDRSTPYRNLGTIQEGDMNIITGRILKKSLEELGAEVLLTREETEPVTKVRPEDLISEALDNYILKRPELADKTEAQQIQAIGRDRIQLSANYLFFRKYEFLARSDKIRAFHPDITIVLYINATPSSAWARLIGADQNIFFIHGAYTKQEAQDPIQQIRLLYKVLDRVTPVEYEVATAIAHSFTVHTGIKPVPYMDSNTTRAIDPDNPYVVARNLGANRYYDGPVVTTEPYFMNNRTVARRLLAGDYEGEREIDGKSVGSIFREYAGCVTEGILKAYGPQSPLEKILQQGTQGTP